MTTPPDWPTADRAYQQHHTACPQCRAAGTSPNTQQRCEPLGHPGAPGRRKQDDALILQLVEALEVATTPLAKDRQEVLAAITAARARLEWLGKLDQHLKGWQHNEYQGCNNESLQNVQALDSGSGEIPRSL